MIAVLLGLLVAVAIARNAAVAQLADVNPDAASRWWPDHSSVQISRGLVDIARAARVGRPVDPAAVASIETAAAKAPLSPQPFLVAGVQAQVAGRPDDAATAFLAAQRRDPRSLAAAYFLANRYLQTGDVGHGLDQFSLLSRLSPGGGAIAAPFIVTYAKDRANLPAIRRVLRGQPDLEQKVLDILGQDPANADAVLALAPRGGNQASSAWLARLLSSMVGAGDYARARSIWASFAPKGADTSALLYDANFSTNDPPPPFNWDFAASNVGLAERQPGGRLHVIFYGNQDGPLARQLLTLAPGAYRMTARFAAPPVHPEALSWSIGCTGARDPIATIAAAQMASAGWTFTVPAGCNGQWLGLEGQSADISQQAEAAIGDLKLVRVQSGE